MWKVEAEYYPTSNNHYATEHAQWERVIICLAPSPLERVLPPNKELLHVLHVLAFPFLKHTFGPELGTCPKASRGPTKPSLLQNLNKSQHLVSTWSWEFQLKCTVEVRVSSICNIPCMLKLQGEETTGNTEIRWVEREYKASTMCPLERRFLTSLTQAAGPAVLLPYDAVTSLHLVETVLFPSKFCSPLLGLIQCHTMHNKETTFPTSLYSGSSLTLRPDLRDISGSCQVELLRKLFKRRKAAGMHLFALPTLLTATWSAVDG